MKMKIVSRFIGVLVLTLAVSSLWFIACASKGSSSRSERGLTVENNAKADIEVFPQLGHFGKVHVTFSPDGKYVLSGSSDHTVKLWEIETGKEIRTFRGHTNYVDSVAFSPDGKKILSGSSDHTVKLWEAETRKEIREFGPTYGSSVAFHPNGKQIIDSAILWDIDTGWKVRTFSGNAMRSGYAAFTPDGSCAVTGTICRN